MVKSDRPDEGARAKIDRAKHHLAQLQSVIAADQANDLYGVKAEDDREHGILTVKLLLPRHLFIGYSVLAGEVIGHIRSALDHVVWQLVPNPVPGVTGFPVVHIEGEYNGKAARMIPGIGSRAAELIKDLQPFGPDYESDPLWVLNELWNWDKHRLVLPYLVVPQFLTRSYVRPDGSSLNLQASLPPDVEDGTELHFRHPVFYSPEMQVKVTVRSIIGFIDGPAAGEPLSELLPKLVEMVENIVNALVRLSQD